MSANLDFEPVKELNHFRGLTNLYHKETRFWLGTRRWWINAILWPLMLGGLVANLILISNNFPIGMTDEVVAAGGRTAYVISLGLSVFFDFGVQAIAIGIIILAHDLLISERQSGVAEWILTKPVDRRAYFLAKLVTNAAFMLLFLVIIPALVTYGLLSYRMSAPLPVWPFLSGVGIMILHSLFYLMFVLMLGTFLNSRPAILGVAFGSLLGGSLLSSLIKSLLYVTPVSLSKIASLTANSQPVPLEMLWPPSIATFLWTLLFVIAAFLKFERMEF